MPGPRDYARSTIFSLATLGEGKCYWPKPPCNAPVTVIINGGPVTNLQIAHIRAAKSNGPRYVPDMSDDERRSWKNLILLCTPHHTMIDKLKPDDYSIEDLEKWKSDRETGGLARLKGLSDLTEDRLQEMLAYSIKEAQKENS
jgi:HNH endonuclease